MNTLPDKLSDLIDVALRDLEQVEKDKRYVIDMQAWHSPKGDACHICFAGAVMAGTLGKAPDWPHSPCDFDAATSAKLDALDAVRCGAFGAAITDLIDGDVNGMSRLMPGEHESITTRIGLPHVNYERDPDAFKVWMRKAAEALREHGR